MEKPNIELWRIHRRSDNDTTGHKFEFSCYASDDTHQRIRQLVEEHNAVTLLKNAGFLRNQNTEISDKAKTEIKDTSDKDHWPESLQQAWPFYIMSVSRMILELIDTTRNSPKPNIDNDLSINSFEEYYSEVTQSVNEVWYHFGSHAFFHHINAVFGYQPVDIQPHFDAIF